MFKHDNVLSISEEKDELPFSYFLYDSTYPDFILLSIAVDYPNAIRMADVIVKATKVTGKVVLAEPFFISNDGVTYLGEDAYDAHTAETTGLDDMEPASGTKH